MYTLLSKKHRKARKTHTCIWCGQEIKSGTVYIQEDSIYDGNFQYFHWHVECKCDANLEFYRERCGEFTPYDNERPNMCEDNDVPMDHTN